jgi:hypothetical protein
MYKHLYNYFNAIMENNDGKWSVLLAVLTSDCLLGFHVTLK